MLSATLAAVAATGRAAHRPLVVATAAAGSIPVAVTVVRDGQDLTLAAVALALAVGAAVGWSTDDPASEVLAAAPLGPLRLPARVLWTVVLVTVVAVVVLVGVAVVSDAGGLSWRVGLREAVAAAGVALGAGALVARQGNDAGSAGVVAGWLVPVFVAGLAVRWPAWLPGFADSPTHTRWWWLGLAGVSVAIWASSEPLRRRAATGEA